MFDLFAMLLCSVASFLFPIFASYKALKTSDPAQLTPWLMYWVVFSCCLLVESWFNFILIWVPFYGYLRLLFLLYLILPQTQGARIIYEERVHPFLEENEASIDDFIATSHSRLKAAGLSYFRQAIEYIKEHILNLPPSQRTPSPDPASFPNAQSYTQSLLARFSVPAPRWAGAANHGADFYNFLAGAMSAATGVGGSSSSSASAPRDMTASGTLIPPNLRDSKEKMSFIATQRERLTAVMAALDREAQQIDSQSTSGPSHVDGADEATQRPPSGLSMFSALSKSRSEADFEKIEAESGAEEDNNAELRKRHVSSSGSGQGASWMPWGLGGGEHQQQHPKDE